MTVTKKDLWMTVVGLLAGLALGLGLIAFVPYGLKNRCCGRAVTAALTIHFCLLRFPAIAPTLHRNLVKNLGLKTEAGLRMTMTKKEIWFTVVGLPLAIVVGLGVNAVIPQSWKADFAILLTVTFIAFYCLLRFPAIASKLHRNMVKNLGLKTDH